ncbi:hypothetical protein ACJ73_00614 [Blastomyces percursus]|uniref:Uncharacterized protein n=1 Tax=Blastomyces percursus TaxID=1658174 RepID=A0A1J9RK53_9EURO|nr:hypothetical protein ACJ73_00614 [Blastomyces percursus]
MRATTYSILAAFFSLAPLCKAANAGAQGRPKYYFPREANRDYGFAAPAEKRAPQVDPGTTVVIVPVTVYVGPDGERYTLGGHTSTATVDATMPKASANPEDEDPEDSPSSPLLGGIGLGLPNLFAPPSASISGTEGVSFDKGGVTDLPAQTPSPSLFSSSSKKGLLDGFPTLEIPGLNTPTPPLGGTGRITTTDSVTATQTASETESEPTDGPILTLPPLFPTPSSSSSSDSATESASGIRSDLTDLTPLPSSSSSGRPPFNLPTLNLPSISIPPIFTPMPSPSASMPITSAPGNTTDGGITIPPFPTLTVLPPSSTDPIPSQNSSSTYVIPTPSTTPSGVFPNPTDRPTGWVPPKNSTTVTPTTTFSPIQTMPPPPPSSKEPEKPISTDSLTSMIIPTSIIFQPTPVPPNPLETNKPTSLPRIISPDSGIPGAPANSRLIQIGFNSSLSYEFVVLNKDSNAQIFKYAPLGVRFGLQIPSERVTMHSIQPYDILSKNAYTTALALMYIPKNSVSELSVSIHNPNSLIYQNPDLSTAKLMSLIDPSIPLIPGGGPIGQENNPGSGGSGGSGGSIGRPGGGKGGSEGGDDETEGPGGSGGSSSVKAASVGIGLGVVGGAALYGAAMFFVARRYRKRRKLHRRTSSLTSGMGEIGIVGAAGGDTRPIATDALMSGGRSDGYTSPTPYAARDNQSTSSGSGSGRNQMISAPVMAENSLGWN